MKRKFAAHKSCTVTSAENFHYSIVKALRLQGALDKQSIGLTVEGLLIEFLGA
jgi:hypothetical protein